MLFLLAVLAGCVNVQSTPVPEAHKVYPITQAQADSILDKAMARTFPGGRWDKVANGVVARIVFALDIRRIYGFAYPAKGTAANGQTVDGFRFEVRHSGTRLVAGPARARQLDENIRAEALMSRYRCRRRPVNRAHLDRLSRQAVPEMIFRSANSRAAT